MCEELSSRSTRGGKYGKACYEVRSVLEPKDHPTCVLFWVQLKLVLRLLYFLLFVVVLVVAMENLQILAI